MATGRVQIERIGRGVGPSFNVPPFPQGDPAVLVTQDWPAMPRGVYWFTHGFEAATVPNGAHSFVQAVSGLGLTWTRIRELRVNSASVTDTIHSLWTARGTPQPGPILVDVRQVFFGSGGTEADGPFVSAAQQEYTYALYRLKNVPLDADPIVQGIGGSSFVTTPPGTAITFTNPISNTRNAIFAFGAAPSRRITPLYPMLEDWNSADEGHPESQMVALSAYVARTTNWIQTGSGNTNVQLYEIGYRRVPWLRQKQRDDNPP